MTEKRKTTLLILSVIGIVALSSCTKDYDIKIEGVEVHGNTVYDDFSVETEFLNDEILLGADFEVNPSHGSGSMFGPKVGDVTVSNPVVVERISLTSNKAFFTSNDTVLAGNNLIQYFSTKRIKEVFRLSHNFKAKVVFLNESDFYKFFMKFELTDNSVVQDSCLVRIDF